MAAPRIARVSLARAGAALAVCLALCSATANAHPVPRQAHDRVIAVRLEADRVVVQYRLEVDEFTVVYEDLRPFDDQLDRTKPLKPNETYEAFRRIYAPILADNLTATLDGKPLTFRCRKHGHTLEDEARKQLGHLRCDFVFEADWKPTPGARHIFTFREGNYELEAGTIRLSLEGIAPLALLEKTQPEKALQERPERDLKPGDDARLRKATATFQLPPTTSDAMPMAEEMPAEPVANPASHGGYDLRELLNDPERSLWLLILAAAGFGAVHALQPGHGKTLVAAYLVGERGTVWHAILLGIVTTLSHTWVVIVLAVVLRYWFRDRQGIEVGLEMVSGLIVAALGFWLLLRRLGGGADHVHLFGDHSHGTAANSSVSGWGVVMLGIAGGIIPCWDAILILGINPYRALPLVLAFSAGLAATLVAVGIGVVYIKGFSESRWGQGLFVRTLPLVSAALIAGMGLWMCYRARQHGA